MAASEIDGQGNYQITAPPGWYKVTVVVEKPRAAEGADAYALPEYLTPEKYASIESTPFSIELKPGADAGAYDLELTD